jgi:hypothetical protein
MKRTTKVRRLDVRGSMWPSAFKLTSSHDGKKSKSEQPHGFRIRIQHTDVGTITSRDAAARLLERVAERERQHGR